MYNQTEMFYVFLVFLTFTSTLTDSRSLHRQKSKEPLKNFVFPEDDIIYPTRNSRYRRDSSPKEPLKWKENTIPFDFHPDYYREEVVKIFKAMRTIQSHTCLKFRLKSKNDEDYIYFTNEKGENCSSSVGRQGKGKQKIYLGPSCIAYREIILHEILHALGFWHETSRPDRDDYVIIHPENILKKALRNFKKLSAVEMDTRLGYDYWSIMHYYKYTFSSNGRPTVEAKIPGVDVGGLYGLSNRDIDKINLMYDCQKPRYDNS